MKTISIETKATSDVTRLDVSTEGKGVIFLAVDDEPGAKYGSGAPLTTAQLLPAQAIELARALLLAAGVKPGPLEGNTRAWRINDFGRGA